MPVYSRQAGYMTDSKTFVIPSGEDGSQVTPVMFDRNWSNLVIGCHDPSGIPDSSNFTLKIAALEQHDPETLYKLDLRNDRLEPFAVGPLPTSAGFLIMIDRITGVRRVQLVLSKVTTAEVTFDIYVSQGSVKG